MPVILTVILDFSSRRAAKAVNKRGGHRYDPRAGEVAENGLGYCVYANRYEAEVASGITITDDASLADAARAILDAAQGETGDYTLPQLHAVVAADFENAADLRQRILNRLPNPDQCMLLMNACQ